MLELVSSSSFDAIFEAIVATSLSLKPADFFLSSAPKNEKKTYFLMMLIHSEKLAIYLNKETGSSFVVNHSRFLKLRRVYKIETKTNPLKRIKRKL